MKNIILLFLLISIINISKSLPLDNVTNFYVNSTVGSCKDKQLEVSLDVCNNDCTSVFKITSSKDNVNNYNFTSYVDKDDRQCSTNNYTVNLFNCSLDSATLIGSYSVKCIFKTTPSPSNSSTPSPSPNTTLSPTPTSSSSNEPNSTTQTPKTTEPQKSSSNLIQSNMIISTTFLLLFSILFF
ncbi:hypothetical protein RB653_007499 [Dictyostelium firmibasis]|uniref:Uncharacterized protein n=1 Tax=Dictyostelium firmibasis TaxID=79012 RepID=A0AAN7TVH0_9MYCE